MVAKMILSIILLKSSKENPIKMEKVEAILKTQFRYKIGHNGWLDGYGYDSNDVWKEEFYSETLDDLAYKISLSRTAHLNSSNYSELSMVKTIEYNGKIFKLGDPTDRRFAKYSDPEAKELGNLLNTKYRNNIENIKSVNAREMLEETRRNKLDRLRSIYGQ